VGKETEQLLRRFKPLKNMTNITTSDSQGGAGKETKQLLRSFKPSKNITNIATNFTTWQQAFKEDPALFAGCRSIFLDVGSNRGTHVRKLFEPHKYPACPFLALFDKGFGAAEKRTRPFNETGICTFGFEANPRWTSTYQQLEKAYTGQGWRVKWFAPVAVGDTSGSVAFWKKDKTGVNSDWGFSMTKHGANSIKFTVPTIDLSAFMEDMHKNAPQGYRLMKMDIETAEYRVLPTFLTKQLLCKTVLDMMTIEWHNWPELKDRNKQLKELESQVDRPDKCTSGPSTTVLKLDDESYLDDGMPLPGPHENGNF